MHLFEDENMCDQVTSDPGGAAVLEGVGGEGVLQILKSQPDVIRDAKIDILKREMASLSKEEKATVMAERKALRNRLSARRCTDTRQRHLKCLQQKCAELEARVLELEGMVYERDMLISQYQK